MTTIKIKEYFEDYTMHESVESKGRTVTEGDINLYAGLTGDWHPLHTDVEFAKESLFGERIAHGPLVFSLVNGLCVQVPYSLPTYFIAAYGIDRMRFTAPTKIGDTLTAVATVIKLEEKDANYGVVTSEIKGLNQDKQVVCSYEAKMAVQRRPKSE
ncbi:MaoC/PaaZ C-terminal domain-containing protein [Maricurvus nonylphenolicus]|uniref:MaoC/PaaZ C-terminal domain-containing protein n=1 Tax=Maricurvus nonylphenolicus TaxID=1008307 RepID=UPI0036F326CB